MLRLDIELHMIWKIEIPVRGGEEGEGVTDTDTQEKSEGAWLGRREESLSEGISEMFKNREALTTLTIKEN